MQERRKTQGSGIFINKCDGGALLDKVQSKGSLVAKRIELATRKSWVEVMD